MWHASDILRHAGLTVAFFLVAEFLAARIITLYFLPKGSLLEQNRPFPSHNPPRRTHSANKWLIDYRLVIIGSLLPDLVDKTMELFLYLPPFLNPSGRMVGHSLVFNGLLLAFCLYIMLTCHRPRLLSFPVFALASTIHLLIDMAWLNPRTFFWPLYGWSFGGAESGHSVNWIEWAESGYGALLIDGIGGLVLVVSAVWLIHRGSLLKWLKTGDTRTQPHRSFVSQDLVQINSNSQLR